MSKPLISVIVPVYNVKDYLTECVDSLLAQTFDNYEVLLIDDGSTDGSSTLCESLKTGHPHVHVLHKHNGGLSSARNFGLKHAKADLVAFVDSDDTVKPDYLKSLHDALEKDSADLAVCGYDSDLPRAETLSGKDATIQLLTKQENLDVLAWNKLYKKSLFFDNDIFYPEGEVHEDNLTTYKLYSKAKKVTFVSESLYHYRQRENSITNQQSKEQHLELRERAAYEAIDYFAHDKKLKSAAELSLLLNYFAWLDNALQNRVPVEYVAESLDWLRSHRDSYSRNPFLTAKLKIGRAHV